MQYRSLNVQEHLVIESCMAVATYLHQTYLGQQITTVRRWINECSSQMLVLRAANRPLRPRILTAFRADNIIHYYMHVSIALPGRNSQYPLFGHICWTKVSLKCHTPTALSGHFQSSREGYQGNTKWRKITHSFQKQTFAFLECVWFILKHGC